MSRAAIEGVEFDWFVVDGKGHVGHFATAGFGPVPATLLARIGELRGLYERILALARDRRGDRSPTRPDR